MHAGSRVPGWLEQEQPVCGVALQHRMVLGADDLSLRVSVSFFVPAFSVLLIPASLVFVDSIVSCAALYQADPPSLCVFGNVLESFDFAPSIEILESSSLVP